MAAKSDRFAVPVPAIGIAAIAILELDQRQQARLDADTAQPDRLDAFAHRSRLTSPFRARNMPFLEAILQLFRSLAARRRLRPIVRSVWGAEPHALAAANRGVTGIGGAELRINRSRNFRIGHAAQQELAQRVGMLRRPITRLH